MIRGQHFRFVNTKVMSTRYLRRNGTGDFSTLLWYLASGRLLHPTELKNVEQ